MAKPQVTLREVAVAAGVGLATVSRALSGDPRCAAETRERVRGADLAGVDVPELARLAGMSERSFARCFKAETSQSPGAALLEAHMNLARRLLTGSEEGIDRIAERCGYADRHQFTTRFHAEVKTTPAVYRRRSRFSRG